MMCNYRCPKCNSKLYCLSTASIPSITTYQCYSCGYTSKPIKEEYNCEILPIELRSEDMKKNDADCMDDMEELIKALELGKPAFDGEDTNYDVATIENAITVIKKYAKIKKIVDD